MGAAGVAAGRVLSTALPGRRSNAVQSVLLASGILAPLVYLAADVFGGMRYAGYSFRSQAVSELMAVGAPSESFVDPLFLLYDVLTLAFGIGVIREAAGRSRPLVIAGVLLCVQALIGFTGPTLFEMSPRDTLGTGHDVEHIVTTAIIVLLLFLTIGFAASALGKRFGIYSLVTIAMPLAAGAVAGMDGPRLAAGEPTPWLGVTERISIYSSMLWVAVLAVVLIRRKQLFGSSSTVGRVESNIHGTVAPGFEEVRAEFARNFAERGEIGAAVSAYWRGEKVVDLWGGHRTPDKDDPWNEGTMVVTMSCAKGLAALTLGVAHSRGLFDYDAPVARYWPEFAQNGKQDITVRQLLGHEAGLVLLDEKLTIDRMRDLDDISRLLARQKPSWPPGTRHGYHMMSLGLYMQELIRHVDPAKRTLGQFFRDEIAVPLGLDYYIGLPSDIPEQRLAKVKPYSVGRAILGLRKAPPATVRKLLRPHSVFLRSFLFSDLDWNDRRSLEIELPAGNGVGTARAMARAYSALAEGGAELGISPHTFACVIDPPVVTHSIDEVLGVPSRFSLGFLRPAPGAAFGLGPRSVGAPGAGGSFAFADPDARLGYAYVMNKLDFYLVDDPREKSLRDAVYHAIASASSSGRDRSEFVAGELAPSDIAEEVAR